MSARKRLPDRRENEGRTFIFDDGDKGLRLHVYIGFYDDGAAGEVFADTPKAGTMMAHMIEDGCVMASNLRQRGLRFSQMSKKLGGRPGINQSPLGAIIRLAGFMEDRIATNKHGEPVKAG